jgi:hypothetical protein
MREQEMRLRVFQFLKTRLRNMIMPATVGIGLAVGGCTSASLYSAPVQPDAAKHDDVASQADLAPASDTNVVSHDVVLADVAQTPDVPLADSRPHEEDSEAVDGRVAIDLGNKDAGAIDSPSDYAVKYMGPAPLDAGYDSFLTKYMGGPLYTAVIPDAASDTAPVVRYGTPTPDGGISMPMYTAPMPQPS